MSAPNEVWSFTHEFDNRFIYYMTGSLGVMYIVAILIVYFSNPRTTKVVNLPSGDGEPEVKAHKYLVVLDTSHRPGVSCPKEASVHLQLVGRLAKTRYFKLEVYNDDRFTFQRANKDLILLKSTDFLGEVMELKILISHLKWKPLRAEVIKVSTLEKYKVHVRVVYEDQNEKEDGIVYPYRKPGCCDVLLQSLLMNHHWLSPGFVKDRFGAYSPVINTLFLFEGMISLITSTLIMYILHTPDDGDDFIFDVNTLLWCIYSTLGVFGGIAILEFIFRNIRCGYLPLLEKFLKQMKEQESIPKKPNPLYDYLESKKYNFIQNSSSEDSFYSVTEEIEHMNFGSLDQEDVFKSCQDYTSVSTIKKDQKEHHVHYQQSDDHRQHKLRDEKIKSILSKGRQNAYEVKQNLSHIEEQDKVIHSEIIPSTVSVGENNKKVDDKPLKHERKKYIPMISLSEEGVMVKPVYSTTSVPYKREFYNTDSPWIYDEESYYSINEKATTWNDIGVHFDSYGNTNMIWESDGKDREYDFSLQQILYEMDVPTYKNLQEVQSQFRSFLKHLTSFLSGQLKHYKRRIREGDSQCFTQADTFIRKLHHKVKLALANLMFDVTFMKGMTKPVIGHNLEDCEDLESEILPSFAAQLVCATYEHCATCLGHQRTISNPDIDEISTKLMVYVLSSLDAWVHMLMFQGTNDDGLGQKSLGSLTSSLFNVKTAASVIPLKYKPEKRKNLGIIETLISQASLSGVNSYEHQMLYTMAVCVVKLAFARRNWILKEDWEKVCSGSSPEILDRFFHQQQVEMLSVWRICSQAVSRAQQELVDEYTNPLHVYSQFLVRQLTLSRIQDLSSKTALKDMCKDLKMNLYKQWIKQGFTIKLRVMEYLPEVLLSKFLLHVMDELTDSDEVFTIDKDSPYFILTKEHFIHRLKIQVGMAIEKQTKEMIFSHGGKLHFLSHDHSFTSLLGGGDFYPTEYVNVMVDQCTSEIVKALPGICENVINEEILEYTASTMVELAIDRAKHTCMVNDQVQQLKTEAPVVKLDVDFTDTVKDLKPLLMKLKNLQARDEDKNDAKNFLGKMETKHGDFMTVNFQKVVDAGFILDDDAIDRSFTPAILQELEWHITGENRKCIPHFMKTVLRFILFLSVILAIPYVTFIGGQLTITETQEWIMYLMVCIGIYGFGLLPILAIVVGMVAHCREK